MQRPSVAGVPGLRRPLLEQRRSAGRKLIVGLLGGLAVLVDGLKETSQPSLLDHESVAADPRM
jgi:hypothetical protein